MPAVIRISGSRDRLNKRVLESGLPFVESAQVVRRRRLNPNDGYNDTTYNLTISDANGDSVPVQINEARDYLRRIGPLIEGIRRDVDGCHCVIDFSWDFPQSTLGQYNTFPNELIALLHEFEIALMVSVYSQSTSSVNDSM